MSLTGPVPEHPTQYSAEIIEAIRGHLARFPEALIVDPFCGPGQRLAALCDELGLSFHGLDREAWPTRDRRVRQGDARDARCYPAGEFVIVTSPPYVNRISTDYVNGPTPRTKVAGRFAYGISLGRPLHADNLARLCRPTNGDRFYGGLLDAARRWRSTVLLNVDAPMAERASAVLAAAHYEIVSVDEIATRRLGGVANAERRPSHEVLILARRCKVLRRRSQR